MRALITGGAKRLGAAVARGLAEDGWDLVIHCNRSVAEAEALAAEITALGRECAVVQADLARPEACEGLIAQAASFGPLDCLVNNASRFVNDSIADVTWASFMEHMGPNLAAPLLLSRDFARHHAGREGGCIINLLDQKLVNLNPDFLSYTLSKAGLGALTEILAMALAPGIRVCGVAPGLTVIAPKQSEASFARAWRDTPLGRSSTPEEIAAAVRFILRTPSMTGRTIVLDGGESLRGRARDVSFDPAVARG